MVDKFEKRDKCLYCESPMDAKNRNKRFCSNKCRTYWNRENKVVVVKNLNEPTNQVKPVTQPTTNFVINTQRIAELEEELKTVPENTRLGKMRRSWLIQEIVRLKSGK